MERRLFQVAVCSLLLCVLGNVSFSQEEGGGTEGPDKVDIPITSDTSQFEQPNDLPKVISDELLSAPKNQGNPITKPTDLLPARPAVNPEKGKQKTKEPKSEVSFNLLYYLIY